MYPETISSKEKPRRKISFFNPLSTRLHVTVVLMMGCFTMTYMRSSLGMAMTCMINTTSITRKESNFGTSELRAEASRCAAKNTNQFNVTKEDIPVNNYGGEVEWPSNVQNIIFTAVFFGSLTSAIPAGFLAERVSPVKILLVSSLIVATASALFPYFVLNFDYKAVFLLRFVAGFADCLGGPAINTLITRWIPNEEKSQALSLFTVGAQLAGVIGIPISASFCASSFRWPGIFYFTSLLILGWIILMYCTVTNTPAKKKSMTKVERSYLENNLEDHGPIRKNSNSVPWVAMFTSAPILACLYASFVFNASVALVHSYQPTFFKEVLFLKLIDNGLYSALPPVFQMSTKMIWSVGIDSLKQRKIISTTTGVKISQILACTIGGVMFILIALFADCSQPKIALFMFIILGAIMGTIISGFYTSILTLAPAYIGTLTSIQMLTGFAGMLFAPFLVNTFHVYGTSSEWAKIFISIGILTLSSGVIFGCFGSGEAQKWGRRSDYIMDVDEKEDTKKDAKASVTFMESVID